MYSNVQAILQQMFYHCCTTHTNPQFLTHRLVLVCLWAFGLFSYTELTVFSVL